MRKTNQLTIISTFAILIIFTSCDCFQNVTGTVLDNETNQPIEGVQAQKENMEYEKEDTNDNGEFALKSISGGLFGCPAMTVVISKDGYETQTVKIENSRHMVIKLQRTTD
jgi:CarboxypepD_reg-like domain